MEWINKIFPKKNRTIFIDAAKTCIDEVCAGDSSAAEIYRKHPNVKAEHVKEIMDDFIKLIGNGDDPDLTRRLRARWADRLEQLVASHFYTNLEEKDRLVLAQYSESDMSTLDEQYYWSIAFNYTYSSILGGLIINGWVGSQESKEKLINLKDSYITSCQEWQQFVLSLAWKKHDGLELTEDEKSNGKTMGTLMDMTKLVLAGEQMQPS